MNDETTPAERGLALEQRIERLFRARGYRVVHDTRVRGRSGANHQVDVLATFDAPLHTSRIIVEAKAYQSSVDKDRIMKLIHIVNDVGADRGIIVTTSAFTPDAIRTAEGYNIDVWDRARLQRAIGEAEIASLERGISTAVDVAETTIAPKIAIEALRAIVEQQIAKRARGTLGIGKVVETLTSLRGFAYPYYEAQVTVSVEEVQRRGLLGKETVRKVRAAVIAFDGIDASLVVPTPAGVSYDHAWLTSLNDDEISLLRSVGDAEFLQRDLSALGLSDTRTKRAVASLLAKACLTQGDTRPPTYRAAKLLPADPLALGAISAGHDCVTSLDGALEPVRTALVEPAALIRRVEAYWPDTAVQSVSVLYYPYYHAAYEGRDGATRGDAIDGITGLPNERVARTIAGSRP